MADQNSNLAASDLKDHVLNNITKPCAGRNGDPMTFAPGATPWLRFLTWQRNVADIIKVTNQLVLK